MLNKIGQSNEGILSDGIAGLTYLVEHYQEVGKALLTLVAIYGEYRAAIAVTALFQKSAVAPQIIQGFVNLANVLTGVTVQQEALNAATLANPYVFAATAILTLVTVLISYRHEIAETLGTVQQLSAAQQYQMAVQEQMDNEFAQGVAEKRAKITELINVINNEAATLEQRKQAYEKLIDLDPSFRGTLDSQYKSTIALGDAFDHVIKRMELFALAQAQVAARTKALMEYSEKSFQAGSYKVQVDNLVKQRDALEKKQAEIVNYNINAGVFGRKHADTDQLGVINSKLAAARSQIGKIAPEWRKTQDAANAAAITYNAGSRAVKNYADQATASIAAMEKKLASKGLSKAQREQIKADIEAAKQRRDAYIGVTDPEIKANKEIDATPTEKKKTKKPKKEHQEKLAEVVPRESIVALERRVSDWNHALERMRTDADGKKVVDVYSQNAKGDKVKTGETVSIEEAKRRARAAQKALEDARNEIRIKSFEEELQEIKRQTEVRDKLLQAGYSKETVDSMFPQVKDTSYIDYLTKVKGELAQINGKQAAEDLLLVNAELERMLNTASKIDDEGAKIAGMEKRFSGQQLAERLRKSQEIALKNATEEESVQINKMYDDAVKRAIEASEERYRQILETQKTYEEKSLALQKEYDAIKQSDTYKDNPKQAAKIDKFFSEELAKLSLEAFKNTELWTQAFGDLEYASVSALKKMRDGLIKFRDEQGKSLVPTELKELNDAIERISGELANKAPWTAISDAISSIGNESLTTEEKLKKMGLAMDAVSEVGKKTQQITAGIRDVFTDLGVSLDSTLGDILTSLEQTIDGINQFAQGLVSTIKSIASGDIIGAVAGVVQVIGGLVKTVTAWINGDRRKERSIKRQTAALAELKDTYDALAYSMERALGSDKYTDQRDMIRNLEQQRMAIERLRATEAGKKKADKEKLNQYNQQIQGINQSIQSLRDDIIKDVMQTDIPAMAQKIGDALLDAFGKGEDGIKAMGGAFDDMVKNILRNQLNKILEKQLAPVYKNILKAAGFDENGNGTFDGLTPQEIADLKAQVSTASQAGQAFVQQYAEIVGGLQDPTSAQGLKGDIKGVTEKTAGALEGQMNAMRVNQVIGIDIMRNSLLQLSQIEVNTRNLAEMRKDLAELNAKTKNQLAGYP